MIRWGTIAEWRVGAWPAAQCSLARNTERYRDARSDVMMQSLGWTVAHHPMLVAGGANPAHRDALADNAAAEWVARARIAPLRIPEVAKLYAVTLDPLVANPFAWCYRAADGATVGVASLKVVRAQHTLSMDISDVFLARWERVVAKPQESAPCSRSSN